MKLIQWVVLLSSLYALTGCVTNQLPYMPVQDPGGSGASTSVDRLGSLQAPVVALDSDQDGIADTSDQCAGSSSAALVDASGCEIVMGVIEGLKFEPNEAELSISSRLVLSRYVDGLLRYPEAVVAVEGHTDNRGAAAANLELSKERVISVVRFMVANGIPPARIKPFGYGESRPLAPNATPEGREQNRRIEIKVVEGLL